MANWIEKQRDYIETFSLYDWYMDQLWSEALKDFILDALEDIDTIPSQLVHE